MRDKHDKSAVEVKACLYIAAAAFPRHKTPIFEGNELSFIILPFEGSFTFSFIQKAKFRISMLYLLRTLKVVFNQSGLETLTLSLN